MAVATVQIHDDEKLQLLLAPPSTKKSSSAAQLKEQAIPVLLYKGHRPVKPALQTPGPQNQALTLQVILNSGKSP
jgi:hypothetical protein